MTAEAPHDDAPLDLGTAGASTRREYERRRANRERRVRERHPRLGGLLLALRDDPAHERVWARGASAEEAVARTLSERCHEGVVVLHDRRIPRSRANIDHIAVCPTGVWVIDTKRYKGRVFVSRPLFGQAKLVVGGRDRTKLVDGLARQVALVESAVAEIAPDVSVHGALCFADAELPLLRTPALRGFPCLFPTAVAKRLNRPGPLAADRVRHIAAALSRRFPSA